MSACNVGDFDIENRQLTITRKGGKVKSIPVNDELLGAIQAGLVERPKAKSDEPLFRGKYGERMKAIRRTLDIACKKAGVEHVTHHSMRHAFATAMLQKVDLLTVSRLLGHSSIQITANMYVEVPEDYMHEAAQKITLGVDLSKKVGQKVGPSAPKRSRKKTALHVKLLKGNPCPGGGIGRRKGLKILWC